MKLNDLRARGEKMSEALSREAYEAGAGLKAETHFERIFAEYADCASPDAWDAAQGVRALEEWVADSMVGRATAPLDDQLQAWEASAEIDVGDGERIAYQRAGIVIAGESRRERRFAIDRARRAALGPPTAIRTERLERERELLDKLLGLPVSGARAKLSGIDLEALAAQGSGFLKRTADVYYDTLDETLRAEVGIRRQEADRTDGVFIFRGACYDEFFPAETLAATARRQVGEMGLDAEASGRITYDTGERERKRARAFCAPVRVPDEVYLVTRPHGGYVDYRAFWHELGHALHFANAARDLAFEDRWLGDNSVTECYAMLFEHQTMQPAWLRRYTTMSGDTLRAFLRSQGFALLAIVRRYAAKLNYELGLLGGDTLAQGRERYVELLSDATGFRYAPEDALLDLDDGFYSARYLRAWQLEAALRADLVSRFDEDWFRNPRSGPQLLGLLERGQKDDGAAVAKRALGAELSFDTLATQCEAMLS